MYYLTLGRPVEGIYHSSAAVSLAISAGLHLIRSSQLTPQPYFGVLETPFPPPADALEEGERINAFWTVVIVNNYWVAAHGSPSAIPYHDTPIDTPWPLELQNYASSVSAFYSTPNATPMPEYQQLFDALGGGGATVSKFLGGLNVDGFSALALLAKASLLLERAITFSTRYSGTYLLIPIFPQTLLLADSLFLDHSDAAAFESLDVLLEHFVLSIPLGLDVGILQEPQHIPVVTQTLAQAAIIRLHAHRIHTSDASRSKYISAARNIVHIINSTDFSLWPHVDPIMGVRRFLHCQIKSRFIYALFSPSDPLDDRM